MIYLPNTAYVTTFTTQDATGAASDADSTPTATARKNSVTDGAFTLTVTNLSTGLYKVTGTVPSGYVAGDVVQIEVSATMDAIAGKAVVDQFSVDTKRVSGLVDAAAAPSAAANATQVRTELTTELGRIDAAITTRHASGAAVASVSGAVGSVTGNVGGNVVGTVASVAGAVGSVTDPVTVGTLNANTVTASAVAADAVTEIQSGLATAAGVSAVGAAVTGLNDLDSTEVQTAAAAALTAYDPPTRTEATADKDAVIAALPDVSGLATQASVNTIDDFLDTEVAAIKAKTDNLPASPAAVGSAMTLATDAVSAAAIAADAVTEIQSGLATAAALGTVDDFLDTEVAAIKAKTDLIPADPATVTKQDVIIADTNDIQTRLPAALVGGKIDAVATATVDEAAIAAEVDTVLTAAHGAGAWSSGAAGTGARTITVTVTDDAAAIIEGASVRLTKGIESFVATTNASGVATLLVDDGTWAWVTTATGYSSDSGSLVVNGDETLAVELAAIVYTPAAAPDTCRVHFDLLKMGANVVLGSSVTFRVSAPRGEPVMIGSEFIPFNHTITGTADADGVGYVDVPYSALLVRADGSTTGVTWKAACDAIKLQYTSVVVPSSVSTTLQALL